MEKNKRKKAREFVYFDDFKGRRKIKRRIEKKKRRRESIAKDIILQDAANTLLNSVFRSIVGAWSNLAINVSSELIKQRHSGVEYSSKLSLSIAKVIGNREFCIYSESKDTGNKIDTDGVKKV